MFDFFIIILGTLLSYEVTMDFVGAKFFVDIQMKSKKSWARRWSGWSSGGPSSTTRRRRAWYLLLRTGRNLHNNYVSTVFYVMEKNIPVSSSQFLLGSIFVAFSPKGLFIKAVKLFFQPVSPGHCTIFSLNEVNNRANVYPKNTFPWWLYIWASVTMTFVNLCTDIRKRP